jgi:hypothetical protein
MKSLISSLVVFRELYDTDNDIYDVLKEFIKKIIIEERLFSFSSIEMKNKLESAFDFKIPEAVVKTTLKRLHLNRAYGKYNADLSAMVQYENIEKKSDVAQKKVNGLLIDLYNFIESKLKETLNNKEKKTIEDEFYNFLLDETDSKKYSKYIASYIIEKNNHELLNVINIIREGLILYSGLNYYDINNLGSWQNKLTIYMDTEVIFDMAGYNGSVYKLYFDDFYNYVKEINSKSRKLISLKYLDATEREIHSFFQSASAIIMGRDVLHPQKSAMISIVNGCKTPSGIQEKKADLFTLMKNNQIELEQEIIDVTGTNSFQYNMVDRNIMESLNAKFGYDVYQDLMLLNNIKIRRNLKGENNFSNIGCIFLTGNKKIMDIAFAPEIRKNGTVPLATTVEWLTNKFWFKMNKGFGQNKTPHNADIILKSQVVLSSIISETLSDKYQELLQENKNGKLSKEQAQNRLIELRKMPHKPEDIGENDIDEIISFLTEEELEKAIKEQDLLKMTVRENEQRNIKLQKEIEDSNNATFSAKKETLEVLNKNKQTLDITHKEILKTVKIRKMRIKIIFMLCCIILPTLLFFFLPAMLDLILTKFTDRQISIISIITAIITFIISTVLSIIKFKKIDLIPFIKKIYKKIESDEYKKRGVNSLDYNNLVSRIDSLEKELNN